MGLVNEEKEWLSSLMSSSDLFKHLTAEERSVLIEKADKLSYLKSDVIIQQGQFCTGLYIVSQGFVGVWMEKDGERKRLALLGFSRFFGEMSLLGKVRCSADVIAEDNSVIFKINPAVFRPILKNNSKLFKKITETSQKRMKNQTVIFGDD